jgi:hypothetical protein
VTVQPRHKARPYAEEMPGLVLVIGVLTIAALLVLSLT